MKKPAKTKKSVLMSLPAEEKEEEIPIQEPIKEDEILKVEPTRKIKKAVYRGRKKR